MIDRRLRVAKDRVVGPVAARVPPAVTPGRLTAAALVAGAGAGVLVAAGWRWWALAAFLVGRLLDGLDGAVARRRGRHDDLGGYLDLMGDAVVYVAVPLGVAAAAGGVEAWVACAVLLAACYLNALSWTLLAAIAEKRGAGAAARGDTTSVHMPAGVVEGAETIVLYALMLAVPAAAVPLCWLMAGLVALGAALRVAGAHRQVRPQGADPGGAARR